MISILIIPLWVSYILILYDVNENQGGLCRVTHTFTSTQWGWYTMANMSVNG